MGGVRAETSRNAPAAFLDSAYLGEASLRYPHSETARGQRLASHAGGCASAFSSLSYALSSALVIRCRWPSTTNLQARPGSPGRVFLFDLIGVVMFYSRPRAQLGHQSRSTVRRRRTTFLRPKALAQSRRSSNRSRLRSRFGTLLRRSSLDLATRTLRSRASLYAR
jgi:hypothetical protein